MHKNFVITQKAEEEIIKTMQKDEILRIQIIGGGCQGYQYKFIADKISNIKSKKKNKTNNDDSCFDVVFFHSERKKDPIAVIDSISMDFLQDAILDFQDDFMKREFIIKNKAAASGCGCGVSFSFKKKLQ